MKNVYAHHSMSRQHVRCSESSFKTYIYRKFICYRRVLVYAHIYIYIFIWCIQAGTQLHSRPEGTGHVCQIQEVRHTCQDARGGLFHYHHNSASDRHQGTQNPSQRHCIRCIYFRIVLVAERGPFRALRCPSV